MGTCCVSGCGEIVINEEEKSNSRIFKRRNW
jgi:hypothetical protein